MKKVTRTGRNPTTDELREAKRLAELYAHQPQNHPHAIAADHSALAHINTYGRLPDYYFDLVFQCRECGTEEIWLSESQKWYYETAKGHINSTAVLCHECRAKNKRGGPRHA